MSEPSANADLRFILHLSAAICVIAVLAAGLAAFAFVKVGNQAAQTHRLTIDNARTIDTINYERRRNALASCRQQEKLKTDLRTVLKHFHVNVAMLPSGVDGRPALSPTDCTARVAATVTP